MCGVRCAGLVVGSIVLNLGNYVQSWRQVGDNCFSDIASLKTKLNYCHPWLVDEYALDILSLLAGNVSLDKDLKAFYANSTGLTQ